VVISMKTSVMLKTAAATLVAVTVSGGALAQSEADRIKALENQIESMQKVIEEMRGELKSVQESGTGDGAGRNRVVLSRDDKVKLSIEGQVNRALLYYNDGNKDAVRHVDNDASSTRLAFKGSAQATDDLKLGATIEVQFESNSTADVNQADNTAGGTNSFTQRKMEIFASSKRLGKVTMGQGSTGSDGMTESDLSGTDLVGYSAVADSAAALSFATATTGAIAGNPTVGGAFDNLDGLSRDDRLRYDSPNFNGIVLSTSTIDGGEWDIGVSYDAAYDSFEVSSKLGFANQSGTQVFPETILGGSLSILHNGGFNLTAAAAKGDDGDSTRDAQEFWYGKLGYIAQDLFKFGSSHISVDYGQYDNFAANNDEGTTYGFQFVQSIGDWGTDLYAGYRRYDLERTGATFDEIDVVLAGARVKF
jgi:hypothetical protein